MPSGYLSYHLNVEGQQFVEAGAVKDDGPDDAVSLDYHRAHVAAAFELGAAVALLLRPEVFEKGGGR